jgi:hypothetical protein
MALLLLMVVVALPGTDADVTTTTDLAALTTSRYKERTRDDDVAYAPCDATRLLPFAAGIGNCTAFLRHGATCTQTGLGGYRCFSKCQHGTLVDGRCFQAAAAGGGIIDLATASSSPPPLFRGSTTLGNPHDNLWSEPRPRRQGRVLNTYYMPLTDSNVNTAANLWVTDQASAAATYGLVHTWDLSQVTSLNRAWCGIENNNCGQAYMAMRSFNGDISMWDVSNVASMHMSKSIRIFENHLMGEGIC